MPSRKITAISIVCGSAVVAVWLLTSGSPAAALLAGALGSSQVANTDNAISVATSTSTLEASIASRLGILDTPSINTVPAVSSSTESSYYPGEGTLTDQIGKDFMSQYLLSIQSGQTLTTDQATQIAANTLQSQDYTKATGVLYTVRDLHVGSQTNKETVVQYGNTIQQSLHIHTTGKLENEYDIVGHAVDKQDPTELNKLDPIIAGYKHIIATLVTMDVPADAVDVHLKFLNAVSNVLSNIEGMRETFNDPVRSFAAVSQYKPHALDLANAYKDLNAYISLKTK